MEIEHKNDDFIYLTLYKWGEEASLQVVLDKVPVSNHVFSGNKIEVEDPDYVLRVYPIDTRTTGELYGDSEDDVQCHDGGVRFEFVLKNTPVGNSFSFPITADNLRFSYQPFLTEQEKLDGEIKRPLNVEGSYAVYHTSKKNNQYMTGKAFHIFRPIAEDALGVKAWCTIIIDAYLNPTSLTVTVPQQFLDDATYPITIDPDFGYSAIGVQGVLIASAGTTCNRVGSAWAMPAPGGTANYIRARLYGDVAVDCKVFINQRDSGGVGTHGQIATKENLACAALEHWEEFTLGGEVLTQAVNYILNICGDDSDTGAKQAYNIRFDQDGATTVDSYDEVQTYVAPESPWVIAADAPPKIDYSIYCNYDLPGPTGPSGGEMQMRTGLGGDGVGTYKGYHLKRRR